MTPERWQEIEEVFHEVVDLDEPARLKFLEERLDEDEELGVEVRKLLAQYDAAGHFIEKPLYESDRSALLSDLLEDDDDPLVGTVLGNYQIDREIGRGGMGAVYEARRSDGEFRKRVALKVVKRGVDTDFVLKRFRNERQILAGLDHPFITRLIDGGTTEDGRPYFVMDYIDGLPLYRHADKNRLTLSDRLKLFCRICEAVEYAHRKQVIHRDLKPSNIFIANDGTPRLLDFGIAKLLNPELASDTLQPTATALRMMTIDYASPEQVRGEPVTYSTDVYSLGVILFELLTGHRPYRLKSRSPHDVARAVCDDEPTLPSNAVGAQADAAPVVPVNSSATTLPGGILMLGESPEAIRNQLRGNLDSVIMKALRKKASDRYESVEDFRDDIDRHLNGEVVSIPQYFRPRDVVSSELGREQSKLLAVLPLSLLSPAGAGSTDEAYLTVGLADAIITRLTSVRQLTIRPTSSISRYSEGQVNPFRAGLELGVDYVLDGRIRRFGERLRLSLQLLDVRTGAAIWARQFDEKLTDVLELEDVVSEQVAAALIPQLTGEEREKLAKRGTDNPHAYEAYLKGRFYWNQFTPQSLPKAIAAFQRAIELDPEYALAYVGVADFYIWANIYGLVPVTESYEHANAAARRALEIDNQLGEAYASLGLLVANQYDIAEAEQLHLKSIELNPNYPLVHEWYSALLVSRGDFEKGLAHMRRAAELDPLSLRTKTLLAWTTYQTGDFEAALERAEEIISLDETYPQGHLQRAYALCELGRGSEALESAQHGMSLMPDSTLAQYYLSFAMKAAGQNAEVRDLSEVMIAAAQTTYVKPMFLGLVCVAAGRIDEAFEYLEIAVDERDPWLIWFKTEPKLEPVRSDPRYGELLRRIQTTGPYAESRDRIETDGGWSHSTVDAGAIAPGEAPTKRFGPGFFTRNWIKFAAAAAMLLGAIGYQTGIVSVQYAENTGPASSANLSRSIAVLPFDNVTGDVSNDYLADGITENLIAQLAGSDQIRVISRSASFAYKGKSADPVAIGRELNVDSVLVGSLGRSGSDYTVRAELVNVASNSRLVAADFLQSSQRAFALPTEIASRLNQTLTSRMGAGVPIPLTYTTNNEAFQLYLQGEFHRQKGTPADTKTAIGMYRRAVEIDPQYALAYQGLALAYRLAPAYGTHLPSEAYPAAKAAAETALAIDPSLGSAHVPLASIKFVWDWDFTGAEREYKEAIRLAPSNSEAHYSYGNFLVAHGRIDEALGELRLAQQLDPLSLSVASNVAWALYIAGRFDEAEAQVRQVISRDPNFARAHLSLGEIFLERGKFDESIEAFQRSRQLAGDPLTDMALGHVYAASGRAKEARKMAEELEAKVLRKEVSAFLPAVVYAGLNDKDKAFYWLERAYQERSNWLTLIKVGRRMKNLHDDPRWEDLLDRVGF